MKRRIARLIVGALVMSPILLLTTGYALLQSNRFVVGYLLPFISKQIGTPVSASSASIKPFRELSFADLSYGCATESAECPKSSPLSITAKSLKIAYDFRALFSRKLSITSCKGESLRVALNSATEDPKPPANIAPEHSTPTPQAGSETSSFAISIANATITDGSFTYIDPASNSRYDLKNISISVPHGESNGDTEIALRTLVDARTESLSLRDELLSGTVTLRNASMFIPESIAIDATAGSAKPAPLEFSGTLNFAQQPYGLDSITVTRGVVRDSLPTLLAIPVKPLRDFEYLIRGNYNLAPGKPFDITLGVQRHRFIGTSDYDLQGSSISSKLAIDSRAITLTQGSLDIKGNGATLAQGTFSGTIPFSPAAQQSKLRIDAALVDFDQLEVLLASLTPPGNPGQTGNNASPAPTPTAPAEPSSTPTSLPHQFKLPLIDASLTINKAIYQKLTITNVATKVVIPNPQSIEKAEASASFDNGGTFSLSTSGRLDQTLQVKARAEKVNVLPFAALMQGEGELLEGNLDSFDLNLSLAPLNPRKTITGAVRTKISRLIVPSTLQSQVPFNILFLPFDALITVFGGTLNAVLPASISSISDGIRQVLDDAGRLGIEKGTINLDFDRGKITCPHVEIDTKNLPDFTIKGSVTAEDKLDFTIFIALLKLNLPLPVAGSLSTPLPDIVYLGPEIVRGLGLSVGNIIGGVGSLLGGSTEDQSSGSPEKAPAAGL
jgi:hypothetical protein